MMTSTTTVRPAQPSEQDEIRELLRTAYREHAEHVPGHFWDIYLADLVDPGGATTLVALRDGRVAGTARLYAPGTAAVDLPAEWAWVRAVAVDPALRGAGIARDLMTACADLAGQAGAEALSLHTAPFMAAAMRLYERLGYHRTPEWDIDIAAHYGLPGTTSMFIRAYTLPLDQENTR